MWSFIALFLIALCAISGWAIFSPKRFFADFSKKDKIMTSISFISQLYLMTVADQKTFQFLQQFLLAITICACAIIFVYFIREYHNNKKKRNFNELQICMGLMFVAICMTMTNSGRLPVQLGILCNGLSVVLPALFVYWLERNNRSQRSPSDEENQAEESDHSHQSSL